jgi:hypothetical protein
MTLPVVLPMLGLEGIVLRFSSHPSRATGVCAMEAVAWLAGEPHSDHPSCACPVIGSFMRSWNDALPDDDTRTRLLRPLLPLILNTRNIAVELERSYLALDWLVRVNLPEWLDLRDDLKAHAIALRGLAPLTDEASYRASIETLQTATFAASAAAKMAGVATEEAATFAASAAARAKAASAAAWAVDVLAEIATEEAATFADALAPTVTILQASAAGLVKRMCAIGLRSNGNETKNCLSSNV